jgi:dihydroflavonol-4-reductase
LKALVTGATGFIGGNVVRALVSGGHQAKALVRPESTLINLQGTGVETALGDVTDRQSIASALDGCDAVIHCAAVYSFWSSAPDRIYEVNVEGTKNVLEEAARAKVNRVVYTSTVSTVKFHRDRSATEEDHPEPSELTGHYKKSKYLAEKVALEKAEKGLPVVVVNPTYPVGPWDVKPTPSGRVVVDFLKGKVPAYVNTGLNVVDVEDVAKGHVLALERGRVGERYLLGNRNMSLEEILRTLASLTGRKPPRFRIPFWAAMAAGYLDGLVESGLMKREPTIPVEALKLARKPMYVDCTKAVNELGLPQSPVEGALEKAVKWFKDHNYC